MASDPAKGMSGISTACEDSGSPSEEAGTDNAACSAEKEVASAVSDSVMTDSKRDDDDEEDDSLVICEGDEKSDGGDSDEKDFEPSLDMMINDFDDERTMEEEEAMEANDDEDNEQDELSALEKEQDMPLEELLKLYNYRAAQQAGDNADDDQEKDTGDPLQSGSVQESAASSGKHKDKEAASSELLMHPQSRHSDTDKSDPGEEPKASEPSAASDSEKRRALDSPPLPAKRSKSELARFYEATVEGRSLRSTAPGLPDEVEEEESEEESDQEGRDFSWKKSIMIGPMYQAMVPLSLSTYDDTLPYENEDKKLWDPHQLPVDEVETYLMKAEARSESGGVACLPKGCHVKDDEQTLFLLLQCGYSCEEALRRHKMNASPAADTMSLWSEEECRAFELGLRLYGKDFHMIQQQKVRTRSVGELVQFYYLWKKTERHDVFANSTRLEKKKYTLHPGITDFMDRFMDEQDHARDRSSSPTCHTLLMGSSDAKLRSGGPGAGSCSGGLSLLHSAASKQSSTNGDLGRQHFPSTSPSVPCVEPPAESLTLIENGSKDETQDSFIHGDLIR